MVRVLTLKMTEPFPVMEILWNFNFLKNMENEKKPGKMRISVIIDTLFKFIKCGNTYAKSLCSGDDFIQTLTNILEVRKISVIRA